MTSSGSDLRDRVIACIVGTVVSTLSLPLVGCGGSGHKPGGARALFVGQPHPDQDLMSALDRTTRLHFDPAEIDGTPDLVVLTGDAAAQTAAQMTDVLNAYIRDGIPVVLADSTHDHANDFEQILGLSGAGHNDGLRAHWRAARMDAGGDIGWTHFFVQKPESDDDDEDTHRNFTDTLRTQSYINSYSHLSDWVGSDPPSRPRGIDTAFVNANVDAGPVLADLEAVTSGGVSSDDYTTLSEIENSNYQQTIWDTYYDSDDDETEFCEETSSDSCAETAAAWPYGRYTITTYSYTVYDYDTETDYWMFVIDANLAQSNAYTEDGEHERAWFVSKYQFMNAFMYHGSSSCGGVYSLSGSEVEICADGCSSSPSGSYPVLTESAGLSLLDTSPSTTENCTIETTTTSTDYSVSGQVGNVSDVAAGVDFGYSTSYSTEDVCVDNDSGGSAYNLALITSDITTPSTSTYSVTDCYHEIESPSGSATSTFQPSLLWIWSTDSSIRKAQEDYGASKLSLCSAFYTQWEDWYLHDSCSPFDGYNDRTEDHWYNYMTYSMTVDFASID